MEGLFSPLTVANLSAIAWRNKKNKKGGGKVMSNLLQLFAIEES